jgi:hypothetical protein
MVQLRPGPPAPTARPARAVWMGDSLGGAGLGPNRTGARLDLKARFTSRSNSCADGTADGRRKNRDVPSAQDAEGAGAVSYVTAKHCRLQEWQLMDSKCWPC